MIALLCVALLGQLPAASDDVPPYLQEISVTIHAGNSEGSGIVKLRNGTAYIWTAGHVIANTRVVETVVCPENGQTKTVVSFPDPQVVLDLYENNTNVGKLWLNAEVLKYSAPNAEDLALLRVRRGWEGKSSVVFAADKPPKVGTRLWHCASSTGQDGSNAITDGLLSQVGRVFNQHLFDQTSCSALPGASGGGVYLPNGSFVGMLVRGKGEGFNLVVPVRRLRAWAKRVGAEFAMDDAVPVPSEEVLHKQSVDCDYFPIVPLPKSISKSILLPNIP